jgi:hypothetical protein
MPAIDWTPPTAIDSSHILELDQAILNMRERMQPASRDSVKAALARLVAACPFEDSDQRELEIRFSIYLDDLSDYPAVVVEDACQKWRRHSKFFPHVSELLAIVRDGNSRGLTMLRRLVILRNVADNPASDGIATREWLECVSGRNNQQHLNKPVSLSTALKGINYEQSNH